MRKRALLAGVACVSIVTAASSRVETAAAQASSVRTTSASASSVTAASSRALVDRYCVTCHNEKLKTGGLALDQHDVNHVGGRPQVWEKVVQKLRAGVMPPMGRPRPDKATYDGFAAWLEAELDRAALARPNPGRPPAFHRFNRAEYHNAVRDLLGLEIDVAALLPSDDASYGFDNIGDILGISPTLLEGYLEAARRISQEAVGDPGIGRETYTYRVPADFTQDYRLDGLPFGTRGGILVRHTFPVDGEYELKVQLLRSFIGGIMGLAEQHQLEITLDGQRIGMFAVGGRRRPAGDADAAAQGERNSEQPDDADLQVRVGVKAGPREIGVAFIQRPSSQNEDLREPYLRSYAVLSEFTSGQPHVASLAVSGPYDASVGDTPSRQAIFICRPERASQERACATRIVSKLARRAYRRPVTDADLEPLMGFYEAGRRTGTFETGVQKALHRLLVSPEFLVRFERDPANLPPDTNYKVSDLELASRLSFFLWSSLPDEELLDVAEQGRLRNPSVLERQVRRLLADERSRALGTNFAGQWLFLRNVPATRPDTQIFPDFDENLRNALRRETELLFETVLRENRSALDLLGARYTYVNERLARHYGMPNIYGDHFRRVELGADDPRGGLLGHGSVQLVTAYPGRTSPVLRGKWILDNILGAPPPPPPPNVPELQERAADGKVLSMRERMAQHRANPVCASCHSRMDPLGLALENFDAVGRWRLVSESGAPVDASGILPDGTPFDGVRELRKVLLERPDRFVNTLVEKLLTYALGRGLEHYDAPAIRAIRREAAGSEYRLSTIILGIVKSAPFQMRRTAAASASATGTSGN
jgi:mono/diheme cytochrome c family protein